LITPLTVIGAEVNRNLSGTWILNIQLSDDFQEKIKEHVKSARNNPGKPDGYSGASGKGNSRGNPDGYSGASGKGNSRGSEGMAVNIHRIFNRTKKQCRESLLTSCCLQTKYRFPRIIQKLS
jgi:hypothetical protein